MSKEIFPGACACGHVTYQMSATPMFVHGCHCRSCQRETGTAFAQNAMIEADRVELLSGELEVINTPSDSGQGQKIHRCSICKVALWSNYALSGGIGDKVNFIRVGTLKNPDHFPPDIHIYTITKQPWVTLPEGVPAVEEYYPMKKHWPAESLARRAALTNKG